MKNEKMLQIVACFMAAIVIFIPFYVSDVYAAATLNVNRISGTDNVNNFARRQDVVSIEAEASISDTEDVGSDNLRIYLDNNTGYVFFDSCSRTSSGSSIFTCLFSRDFYAIKDSYTFKIDLHSGATKYDDFATPLVSVTETIWPDDEAAKVTSISANPERAKTAATTISFSAEDYAMSEGDTSKCSGIDRIEFYETDYNGELKNTIRPSSHTCAFNSSFNFNPEPDVYKTTICAAAFDRFNQSATESVCADFFFDSIAPEPDLDSLRMVKSGTNETIEFIGQQAVVMDISVVIDAEDLNVSTVKADLSNIAGTPYSSAVPSSHTDINGTHTFKWANIPISSLTACVVTITASDYLGNSADTVMPCSLKIDNEGPSVEAITTPYLLEGVYYLGKIGTLTAHLTEQGIGLNKKKVFIDLSNIIGVSRLQADNCTNTEGTSWECSWAGIAPSASDGQYFVTIYKESKDDLDNIMSAKYEQLIGVDKTDPIINQDVELSVIPGIVDIPYENITVAGDTLEFVLEVSDAYSATANFSSIGGGDNVLPSSCWREEDSTFCLWEVAISSSGPYNADITFDFEDFAGNMNSISKKVFVSGIINETNPNLWRHTVSCSPRYVDRDLASLISQKYYCHVNLEPINRDAEVVSFKMEQYPSACHALENGTDITDYINNIILINNHPGSTDPYMDMILNVADFLTDEFNFACEFTIFTKVGDEYTLNPEKETVEVKMEFYNLPAGVMDENYEKDVKNAQDSIEWVGDWFDDLAKVFDYAERICELYASLVNMLSILTILGNLVGLISTVKPAGAGFVGAWMGICNAEGVAKEGLFGLEEIMDPLCAFVNCKWSKDILEGLGAGEDIQSALTGSWIGGELSSSFDVKQSIVWSTLTLCVPGMIYNLDKYLQIQCRYATCLMRDVAQGIPKYSCDEVKSFQECKFWWGQIFNLIPFVQVFSNYMNLIESYLSDPLAAIGWILDLVFSCSDRKTRPEACTEGDQGTYIFCAILGTVAMIGEAVGDVQQISEQGFFDAVDNRACAEYYEVRDEYEKVGGE